VRGAAIAGCMRGRFWILWSVDSLLAACFVSMRRGLLLERRGSFLGLTGGALSACSLVEDSFAIAELCAERILPKVL
jgi:hypothetical protein